MSISDELYFAILSMDAYNRQISPSDIFAMEIGDVPVGNATWISHILPSGSGDVGFFASTYSLDGNTVISFRGTDASAGDAELWKDILTGWISGAGAIGGDVNSLATLQVEIAEAFYDDVLDQSIFAGPASDVVLIGHSLGGGLAGYLSAISGTPAVVFNDMPFMAAALRRVIDENIDRSISNILSIFDATPPQGFVLPPTGDSVSAFRTEGEILEVVRTLAPGITGLIFGDDFLGSGPFLAGYAASAESAMQKAEYDSKRDEASDLLEALGDANELHSQALLVSLMYADEFNHTDWYEIGDEFHHSFFSEDIGAAAGFLPAGEGGYFKRADKLQTAIAYSVVDEGTRPFGDSAIRAMFDDADELGLAATQAGGAVDDLAQGLTDIVVQYAGELAIHEDVDPNRRAGVVSVSQDGSSLAVDLSKATGRIGADGTSARGVSSHS